MGQPILKAVSFREIEDGQTFFVDATGDGDLLQKRSGSDVIWADGSPMAYPETVDEYKYDTVFIEEKKMDTIDILNQSIAEHSAALAKAIKERDAMKVTYSIADRFVRRGHDKHVLSRSRHSNRVSAVSITDGKEYAHPVEVKDVNAITESELTKILNHMNRYFVRYWDSQKQIKT